LEKSTVEARYDGVARFYDALNFFVDWFLSKHRRELLHPAEGKILEVGVGTGSSFKDYPSGRNIIAVDISREMLRRAQERAHQYNGNIKLRREDAENLPFKDETFDMAFSSMVFCSVTDPIRGLKELHRVLKKGGKLLMLEHVKSKGGMLGYLMDKMNPLIAKYGVDNINRDTIENIQKAGFKIRQERNLAYDVVKAIVAVK